MKPNELKNALRTFKRFSLINYNETEIKEDSIVTLYPTLQFAMDKEQFANIVTDMIDNLNDEGFEEENDIEEETE